MMNLNAQKNHSILSQGKLNTSIQYRKPSKVHGYKSIVQFKDYSKMYYLLSLTEFARKVLETYTVAGPLLFRPRVSNTIQEESSVEQPCEPLRIYIERKVIRLNVDGVPVSPSKLKAVMMRKRVTIAGIYVPQDEPKRGESNMDRKDDGIQNKKIITKHRNEDNAVDHSTEKKK